MVCNEQCTAGAIEEINSTNEITISNEIKISEYLGVFKFNKLTLNVRFQNT